MKKKLLAILMMLSLILTMTACTQASTQKSSESLDLSATSSEISNDTSVSSGVVVNDISTKPEGEALDGPDTRPYGQQSWINATTNTPVYYYEETGNEFDPVDAVNEYTSQREYEGTLIGNGSIQGIMNTLCAYDTVFWSVDPTSEACIEFYVTGWGTYNTDIDNSHSGESLSVTYFVSTYDGANSYNAELTSAEIGGALITPLTGADEWLIERSDATTMFNIMYYDFTVPEQVLMNQSQYYSDFTPEKYQEIRDVYNDWAANMSQVGSDPQ